MILIVGGAYQGKLRAALTILLTEGPEEYKEADPDENEKNLAALAEKYAADGAKDSLEAAMEKPVVFGLHEYIRRFCGDDADEEAAWSGMSRFLKKLTEENPGAIVVCNELGCGIVPMEKRDRIWREAVGDACQFLAERSERVYRVICGIPTAIKGGCV